MNEMYLRFPGGRKKAFTLSYDDNITQDERLIHLMEKYRVKGTFNLIPNWFAAEDAVFPEDETYINVTEKKARELYRNDWVEVANHGFNHIKMICFSTVKMTEDTMACRRKLEEMFGGIITGYAYPYGCYSKELMDVLEMCGIDYARTVCSSNNFELPENWLEIWPTCHYAEATLPQLTEDFLTNEVQGNPYMFYVWGHSFEFDQQDNWNIIEDLLEKVSGKEDEIWYATNGEICQYHKAYQSLVTSADGTQICNPTAVDLWVEVDGKMINLPSGKVIRVEE